MASAGGIIPLAGWMGRSTEWIAERLGPGVGGLLNATFGNAAELIMPSWPSARAPRRREGVHNGSIIGNILLVLGLSILRRRQTQVSA